MKWIARIFGLCGHRWKWNPEELLSVEGYNNKRWVQKGICERCGKERYRYVEVKV